MDQIKHFQNIPNRKLRRMLPVGRRISLIIIENPAVNPELETQGLYVQFEYDCLIFRYTELLQCENYLKKSHLSDCVILLIYGFGQEHIEVMDLKLAQYKQIKAILIKCSLNTQDNVQHKMHSNEFNKGLSGDENVNENERKLIQSFHEWNSLLTRLQEHIIAIENSLKDIDLFSICDPPEKALRDLSQEMGSFIWTHTFRVLLMAMPHNSLEAKQQMIRTCRKYYYGRPLQIAKITEFEKTYRPCDAIRWYTKPCFLSNLINKALRSQNINSLYLFHYFVFDLSESLVKARYSQLKPNVISVYRGTILRREEVEQLRIGSLVSTNGFLSSSRSSEVAISFVCSHQEVDNQSSQSRNDPLQCCLFKIDIDINTTPDVVVADISGESQIPDEKEFLFDLGTTFIITDISYDDQSHLWKIQMVGSNEVAKLNHEYDSYMRERLSETHATILFGRMLAHLSEYSLAVKYYQRLIRVLPIEHEDRPSIHYQLARMYRFLGKHQQAIHYFRCAKLLQRRGLPYNSYEYGMTLAGLGTVYLELNDSKQAVRVLEQASIYYNLFSKNYNTETIFHFNRLSYAYYLEQQYERALRLLNNTLIMYKQKMPADHPGHAQAYHNLGLILKPLLCQ